ncbi:MAG TPA: DUF2721 domain-containing protein [Longimicrobium sp.]|nr:DUF2721 domain-containing protein [Longimicrobium sp.]
MEIGINTPALLFPAISLLLLAFTNRFLALAALIRNLHERYKTGPDAILLDQIGNLRHRMTLIRNMQLCGVTSLFMCVACMFALFAGQVLLGKIIFGVSLILMMIALAISVREIQLSGNALDLQLRDLEGQISTKRRR